MTSSRKHSTAFRVLFACAVVLGQGCGGTLATSAQPVVARRDIVEPTMTSPTVPMTLAEPPVVTLAERVVVPGTGVSLQPPAGARLMRIGAGFLGAEHELEIVVALAEDPSTLDEIARFGDAGPHPTTENVTIDGRAVQLMTQGFEDEGEAVERVWFLARDGARGLAILGEYDANASASVRVQVRESLLSTRWDAHVALDPESAAGYRITATADLAPHAEVVNGLSYARHGEMIAVDGGAPAILVAPLDVEIPQGERSEDCEMLLMLSGPVAADTVVHHDSFATENVVGCEVFGDEAVEASHAGGPRRLSTYAAVVFLDEEAFVVAGIVDAREGARWRPSFAAAARSLAWVVR
jgi:hypothetical protein